MQNSSHRNHQLLHLRNFKFVENFLLTFFCVGEVSIGVGFSVSDSRVQSRQSVGSCQVA